MKTNFKCYGCKEPHYTKCNLELFDGHLYCNDCIKKFVDAVQPDQKPEGFYVVIYISRAGTRKGMVVHIADASSVEEAKAYVLTKKHAKEILVASYSED